MSAPTGVVITGVTGRMGSTLVRVVSTTPGLQVVGGTARLGSTLRGVDIGLAAKLGTRRVIYVEIENLQTRSDASVELYRGSASATMKVIEIPEGATKGTVAYDEGQIATVFPPHAREEGRPDGNDFTYYRGTIDALTTELAKRFVPHEEEQ